jgi:hypothetical protein
MSEIQPGDGWRLLRPDEVVRDGDETWRRDEDRWVKVPMQFPYKTKSYFTIRRRIPAKPEEIEIDGHRVGLDLGVVVIGNLLSHYYLPTSTEAIRKLGEWLISVADWREEGTK